MREGRCGLSSAHGQPLFPSGGDGSSANVGERMMRTLKEECLWLREWASPFELATELCSWIDHYNQHYLHSTLNYKTPNQFEPEHHPNSHITQLAVP